MVGCGQESQAPAAPSEQEALRTAEQQALHLEPPAGCTEVTLGELQNGIELTPVMYGSQPTYRGVFSSMGDPAVADLARIRLDVNTAPGLYDLSTGGANLFACEQCVWAIQDSGTTAQRTFVAESGALLLALKVNPQQTIGALSNVVLRQTVAAPPQGAPYTGTAPVAGGECRWIRFATWNTVRDGACDPREGSLTSNLSGLTCVADNYAADDGTLERSLGTKTQGEACTYTPAVDAHALASTDCAQGYACTDAYTDETQCMATCDYKAADPGCPTGTVCGVYGLCQQQAIMEPIGFAFDPALIGQPCAGFAEFCGVEGDRGVCAILVAGGQYTCYRYARARSECAAGEELGFVNYPLSGGGSDRTYGFCYPDGR
ncbi:hypothetical protein [Pyxidicoccus xibeiensis]|uniref:hypothetical protein n=1 Tax=Pyxidicoccus xibeiensis TaxID=2906759 RepID=UPI0020A78195|nr:hypothetical protein [Pyxidicoccus xibeiensis]MCP3137005.1 hypothetical protein [Pyxidicoccus xibeiensis]